MTVTIQIIYRSAASGSKILQRGSFPLKWRHPQEVAFDWLQQIKREMHFDNLEQLLCNGEDITEIIKEMDKSS